LSWSLHRAAEQDLTEAARFYRREGGKRLAKRFLDEFQRVAELLDRYPAFGTATADERRSYPLQVFPYSLIYRPVDGGVRIPVVRHQHRDPEFGNERTS
jgi:plasmid stabilization system protein ParE